MNQPKRNSIKEQGKVKIQDYLIGLKVTATYANRAGTPTPLYRYIVDGYTVIPDKHITNWIKTSPTMEEMALFYMGVLTQRPSAFTYSIYHATRYHDYEVPVIQGVLSVDFWEDWSRKHVVELMDASKDFYNTPLTA